LRAAAVGGGAYMMGKHHAERRQQEDYQNQQIQDLQDQQYQQQQYQQQQYQQPQYQAPPPSGGISPESMQRLKDLGALHAQGILTDEEFAQQKQLLLAG
jgi:hypothetical protein